MVIDELVTVLGFDMDGQAAATVKTFTNSIADVGKQAAVTSAALLVAASSVMAFVLQSNEASANIEKFSRLTGISSDTVQEMAFAIEQVGGSMASMQGDLQSLTETMNSPIPGEFNEGLLMMGISTRKASGEIKSADEVLLDIADRMEGMTAQKQLQWGKKIGLSQDTILLLKEGRQEIEELRKQARDLPTIVSEEALKNARDFGKQLSTIESVFSYIGQEASAAAGPGIREIVDGMLAWIKLNRQFIQSGIQAFVQGTIDGFSRFGETLSDIIQFIRDLIPGIDTFVSSIGEAEVVSALVYAALLALGAALVTMAAGFAPIIAAVITAGLVIEDFTVYLEGGESAIGSFLNWLDELHTSFTTKFPAITGLLVLFGDVFKLIAGIVTGVVVVAFDGLLTTVSKIGDALSDFAAWAEKGLASLGLDKYKSFFGVDSSALRTPTYNSTVNNSSTMNNSSAMNDTKQSSVNMNITNNISGSNGAAIAEETTRKMNFTLQQTFPGGLAAAAN